MKETELGFITRSDIDEIGSLYPSLLHKYVQRAVGIAAAII